MSKLYPPWSNGTQFMDWQSRNCFRCQHYIEDEPEACPVAAKIPALQDAFIKAEALLAEVETWQERLESVDRLKARIVELETWLEDRDRTIASLTEARR